jgi:hypothetical protein
LQARAPRRPPWLREFCFARQSCRASENWSGRRESNPRMQLGKLPFYH